MADPEKKKRCLYEVLGLNPNCTSDEIRSAYKRLALQLHPDKLIQSGAATPESATAAFQELVNAYEVLSDPRERVWYDSHRSQILFADVSSNGKGSSRSHDLDLFSYFSNSVYSGFTDRGKGFYKVYGDVFGKIYAREVDFAAKLGLGQDSVRPAPLMGNLECPYEQVTAFYGYWLGFCTVMDFSWVDEWDSAAGMNRRARRLMEDENAKVRKKARREYNEMVRDLAKFVKKRDRRVIEMLKRRKEEEEKRKAEEEKKKKEKERERAERARLYEEPEWAKVDEDDGFDGLEEEEEERKDEEEFYCVVCGKKFKSDKQWRNHEQSKKHKERVEEFRRSAEAEDLEFGAEEEEVEALGDEVEKKEEEKVGVDELCEEFENGVEILKEVDEAALDGDNEEKMSADEERSVLEAMLSGRRNRKKEVSSRPSTSAPGKDDEMEYNKTNSRKKGQKKKGRRSKNEEVKVEDSDAVKDENGVGSPEDVADDVQISSCDGDSGARISGEGRNGTREQADWKGKGKKGAVTNMKISSKGKKKKATTISFVLSCDTCGENFESRNKLFMHIGESGHAMLKAR